MEFFLSYIHKDRDLAGKVGSAFEASKCAAFRAHDSLEPDAEWVKEIFKHLESCNALVAIVTPNFAGSSYANQEVGYVLRRGRPVLSFHFGGELPGFLKWRQAISASEDKLESVVGRSIQLVREREKEAPMPSPSIALYNDSVFDKIGEPYRRMLVSPENLDSVVIPMSAETEDWLIRNRSNLLDWSDNTATQFGLTFDTKSGHHGEIANTGEVYFGETVQRQDGIHIGRMIVVIGRSLEWASRVHSRFGVLGNVKAELKLKNVKGMELSTDPFRDLAQRYVAQSDPIIVYRILDADFAKDFNTHVESIIVEMCRAFGLRLDRKVAQEHVRSALGM